VEGHIRLYPLCHPEYKTQYYCRDTSYLREINREKHRHDTRWVKCLEYTIEMIKIGWMGYPFYNPIEPYEYRHLDKEWEA
jgi:hypothetical protein